MNLDDDSLRVLQPLIARLASGFDQLPKFDSTCKDHTVGDILKCVSEKLQNNYPYHHPFYLGQMMKPPHPIAHLAYALAMEINPNNHALDGGRSSSQMEQEAVQLIAEMFGWKNALGHLSGGGTIANLEALWIARELTESPVVAVSSQAHYTHQRCASLLGVKSIPVDVDQRGRMSIEHLNQACQTENVGTVVVTLGTTGLGAIDPLEEVLNLRDQFGFRIHIDSAYGGYYKLASNLSDDATRQFALMSEADSIVVDPHKHGLQPYGCGCVLFRDPAVARVYKHDSPYTYFTSDDLHLGEISLECSRAGAAAVALWATMQRFPLLPGGEFAQRLEKSRKAANLLHQWLTASNWYEPITEPELDIVVWSVHGLSASEASQKAKQIFQAAAESDLHFALVTLDRSLIQPSVRITKWDQDEVTCLRSCLMKPEHYDWMPQIVDLLENVTISVLSS